jgi:hypothetical protein
MIGSVRAKRKSSDWPYNIVMGNGWQYGSFVVNKRLFWLILSMGVDYKRERATNVKMESFDWIVCSWNIRDSSISLLARLTLVRLQRLWPSVNVSNLLESLSHYGNGQCDPTYVYCSESGNDHSCMGGCTGVNQSLISQLSHRYPNMKLSNYDNSS